MTEKKSQCAGNAETNPHSFPEHDKIATYSAEEENAIALAKLGAMYEKGTGVFTDFVNAYMWYFIAEHKGNAKAGLDRARITKKMTATQINKAQVMARQCLPYDDSSG